MKFILKVLISTVLIYDAYLGLKQYRHKIKKVNKITFTENCTITINNRVVSRVNPIEKKRELKRQRELKISAYGNFIIALGELLMVLGLIYI